MRHELDRPRQQSAEFLFPSGLMAVGEDGHVAGAGVSTALAPSSSFASARRAASTFGAPTESVR